MALAQLKLKANGWLFLALALLSIDAIGQGFSDEIIASWGYETNPNKKFLAGYCAGTYSPLQADYQSIRFLKNEEHANMPRYRFTLGTEVYSSPAKADAMVDQITHPPHRTSKHSKMCNMRKAFAIENVVYFVHTDVGSFRSDISNLLDTVYKHVTAPN